MSSLHLERSGETPDHGYETEPWQKTKQITDSKRQHEPAQEAGEKSDITCMDNNIISVVKKQ